MLAGVEAKVQVVLDQPELSMSWLITAASFMPLASRGNGWRENVNDGSSSAALVDNCFVQSRDSDKSVDK